MRDETSLFYQFSGVHSLLIGLLPFFLPALMWQSGFNLSQISWFIALNGAGYAITLYLWDRLRTRFSWKPIIIVSFLLELAVVGVIVLDKSLSTIYLIGLLNGAYGCFFWMTQRTLFAQCSSSENSGRKFGNFQILVMILLKIGILAGGFLWEKVGAGSVFLVTLGIVAPTTLYYLYATLPATQSTEQMPVAIKVMATFRDKKNSLPIFLIDGLFLFAESYFWVISLYFISGENLTSLGILVVVLSVLLAGLFFAIKNTLDKINPQTMYITGVIAYAVSWLARGSIDAESEQSWVYPIIVLVAFLTALFRLTFNKRFFDLSKKTNTFHYIAIKSYHSQCGIAVLFGIIGLLLLPSTDPQTALQIVYWILAPISLLYILYRNGEAHTNPGHQND